MGWLRSKNIASRSLFALAVFVFFWLPVTASGFYGDSDDRLGLDGSFKILTSMVDSSRLPVFVREGSADYALKTVTRLMADGRPKPWLRYEIHSVFGLVFASAGLNLNEPGSVATRYRAFDADRDLVREPDASAEILLDRLNARFIFSWADLIIGRQAITFGKAYFWNPLDVFLAFDPAQLDRDYKPGVDGFRLDIPVGDFSGFNLMGIAGRDITSAGTYRNPRRVFDASWYGSSVLGRYYTTVSGWDLALQAGKIYGGYQIGGGVVGELGPLEVRMEAAYFKAETGPQLPFPRQGAIWVDNLTAVFGLGHRFKNSFTVEAEYLYNGSGDPENLEASLIRRSHGATLHFGKHILGVLASYEFLPLLLGQMVWIYSFSDKSSLFQPSLSVSLADEIDLQLSAAMGVGPKPAQGPGSFVFLKSEFGSLPYIYLLELRFFF